MIWGRSSPPNIFICINICMASNQYFNNYNHQNSQDLYEDLVTESIRMYAHDIMYLPRTGVNKDEIMNEYVISEFNQSLGVEVYISNYDSFQGEGAILQKFGLEIRDQMTLSMSKRSFNEFVKPSTNNERPHEGDCIYIPMTGAMYQITFVNTSPTFYTLGRLPNYEITLELLEFSNEQFNTGIPEIDDKYKPFPKVTDQDYNLEDYDDNAQNQVIETSADGILDFSEINPFGEE